MLFLLIATFSDDRIRKYVHILIIKAVYAYTLALLYLLRSIYDNTLITVYKCCQMFYNYYTFYI